MQESPVTVRVRLIFVVTIALLAAQTFFISRYGEPYPALTMPTFQGHGSYHEGRIRVIQHDAVFVAGGETFSFPWKVLLEEIPISFHGDIAQLLFRFRNPAAPAPMTGRWGRLRDALFPGYAGRRTSCELPENVESLRSWLHGRGEALVPGRQLSRVEIRRFVESVRFTSVGMETDRELIETLVVSWEKDGK